jgi:ABC-type glycerol-3-phosphate transport system substrate-binding protein
MKMVPRQRFAYGMALVGTAFFIILVKEVNNPGGYFYRDEAFQGMDSTVHTWEDREARYKIEDYKKKFREIDNKSNR